MSTTAEPALNKAIAQVAPAPNLSGETAPANSATQAIVERFRRYVVGNYKRYPTCLVAGNGSEVVDTEGRRYLDLFCGWGCNLLGHCPPRVVQAVQEQVAQLIHVPNTWYIEPQGRFAEALVERAFPGQVFFCNSGTEANEAALKLARLSKHAQHESKYKIITALNSFHGRTFGSLSATGQPKYQEGVGPLLPGFHHVPFGDLEAMSRAIDDETAGILVEPIQGEGGVNVPPPGYLQGLRHLADMHELVLIFDEVQTGMGRTGHWFAFQQADVLPDIITLAKALAGGIACGAMIARPELAQHLRPGTHAATFGGNPIACRAGLAAIEQIEEENLLSRATQIGDFVRQYFQDRLTQLPVIRDIRGVGVMIGLELSMPGAEIVEECRQRGLLINCTHENVLRLLPALTIADDQLQRGCEILEAVLLDLAR